MKNVKEHSNYRLCLLVSICASNSLRIVSRVERLSIRLPLSLSNGATGMKDLTENCIRIWINKNPNDVLPYNVVISALIHLEIIPYFPLYFQTFDHWIWLNVVRPCCPLGSPTPPAPPALLQLVWRSLTDIWLSKEDTLITTQRHVLNSGGAWKWPVKMAWICMSSVKLTLT